MSKNTEKPERVRVPLLLLPEEAQELDDWRYAHRHPTRTAALKAMMRLAIETAPTLKPVAAPKGRKKPEGGA